jgi:hypothetical protein
MDSFEPMDALDASRMVPLLRSLASLQMERSSIRHRQPARRDTSPGSAWHAVMIPIRNFSPSPSHPTVSEPCRDPDRAWRICSPMLRLRCMQDPGQQDCCEETTLDISNPSRLRKIPPATKKTLHSNLNPRFRTGTPKDRRCSPHPHHITSHTIRYVRKV